jgi:hypothetical protein
VNVSSQIRKFVLVGFAGACGLASAGCDADLSGEYIGKVDIDAKHITGSAAHASIAKADGEVSPGVKKLAAIKLSGGDFKDCTLPVTEQTTKKNFIVTVPDNACQFATGGSLPKGAGVGTLDGNKLRIDINGTLPLSFTGERAK